MNENNIKGNVTEAMVIARLLKQGYIVSKPVGNSERYDLVVEINDTFKRIQCKSGQYLKGSVVFPVANMCRITKKRKSYKNQIDYFAVYCDELDKVYLVSIDECGSSAKSLRVDPIIKGNALSSSMAKDYEI